MDWLSRGSDTTEERNTDLRTYYRMKHKGIELKKIKKKKKKMLRDMEKRMRRPNICQIGAPKGQKRECEERQYS